MSQLPVLELPVGETIPSMAINSQGEMFLGVNIGSQILLRISQDSGHYWSEQIPVPDATSPKAPAITFVGSRLYVAWTSSDNTYTLYYTSSDDNGRSFQPVTQVSDVVTQDAPTLTGGSLAVVSFKQLDGRICMAVLP